MPGFRNSHSLNLDGSWTALVTPFYRGAIDWNSFDRLVRWQADAGTAGLVVCGTTGETPTLTEEEQLALIQRARRTAGGKMKLMAGCGTNSTAKTIALAKKLERLHPDALLVVTPYYNRPTQRGLKEHYAALAKAVKTPLVIYNVPSRTGVNIEPAVVCELARAWPRIAGIKEASGRLDQVSFICRDAPPGFAVLSGDDSMTLPMMALGARGVVSVASNAAPDKVAGMVRAYLAADEERARKLHLELFPLFRGLFLETSPAPVKMALWKMGKIRSPELRLPLLRATRETETRLGQILADLKEPVSRAGKERVR